MTAFEVRSAVLTHPGRKRSHNEDFVAFFEPSDPEERQQSGRLYIVADGVGGEAKGERASQYAAQKVLYEFYNDLDPEISERLRNAIQRAGNEIYQHVSLSGMPRRMATTMVAAVVREGMLTVANVGDSRAYLIRNGQAQQITRDHTIAGELLRDGEVTEEEARRVKGKHRLTRSLGGERNVHVDIFRDIPLQPGDRVLLCSDGLAKYTLSEDIARLASSGDPEEVVHQSVEYANQHGGSDNITVAVIEIGQPVEADVPTVRRGALPTEVDWDELVTVPSVAMARPRRRRRVPRWQFAVLGVLGVGVVAVGALGLRWILTRGGDLDPLVESMPTHTVAQTATASPAPTSTSNLAATNTPLPTNTPIPTATPDDAEEPSDNLPEPPELKDIPIDELEAGRAKWLTTIETCVYMVQSPEDQDGPDAVSNRFLPAESEEGKDGTYYRINGLVKLLKYKINDTYDEEWKNIDEQLAHQMDENDLLWLGFIPNKTVCEQDFID